MAARFSDPDGASPVRRALRAADVEAVRTAPLTLRVPTPLPPHRHPYRGALLFAALMVGLAALAGGASTEALRSAGDAVAWLQAHNTARGRALAVVIFVAAGALGLIVAWGRETAEGRPVRLAGGRARMAVDEVAAVLRDAILDDGGLADADVRVQNLHRRGLRVTVRADIRPQTRIDETVVAVDATVREVVQGRLGARLATRPAVDVRYEELDLRLGQGI